MRALLKLLLPPIVIKAISFFQKTRIKMYANYSDVVNDTGANYDSEKLARIVREKTLTYAARKEKSIPEFKSSDIDNISLWFYLFDKNEVKVLDYGGASGTTYHFLRKINTSVLIKWDIVETKSVCEINKENNYPELKFITSYNDTIDKSYDLVLLNSVLQYVPDPYDTLTSLLQKKPDRILITRTPFSRKEDFWTIQKTDIEACGPGKLPVDTCNEPIHLPIHTMNIFRIKKIISKFDEYKCVIVDNGDWYINGIKHMNTSLLILKN
jgi:putative methyltransferase (TIGR04325 family)